MQLCYCCCFTILKDFADLDRHAFWKVSETWGNFRSKNYILGKEEEEWDSVCFCIIPKARREICIQQQKAFMNIVQSYGALDMEAYFYCNGKRRHCFLYFSVFFDSSQVEGSANLAPNGGRLILKKSTKLLSFAQHLSNCLAIEISLSISCLTKSRCQCSQQLATVGILGERNGVEFSGLTPILIIQSCTMYGKSNTKSIRA